MGKQLPTVGEELRRRLASELLAIVLEEGESRLQLGLMLRGELLSEYIPFLNQCRADLTGEKEGVLILEHCPLKVFECVFHVDCQVLIHVLSAEIIVVPPLQRGVLSQFPRQRYNFGLI